MKHFFDELSPWKHGYQGTVPALSEVPEDIARWWVDAVDGWVNKK